MGFNWSVEALDLGFGKGSRLGSGEPLDVVKVAPELDEVSSVVGGAALIFYCRASVHRKDLAGELKDKSLHYV